MLANSRVGGFIGKELKFKDFGKGPTNVVANTTWVGTDNVNPSAAGTLCGIVQGAGVSERVGRKANIKSVFINGLCQIPASTDYATMPVPMVVTVALVLDTMANQAAPDPAQIYRNPMANLTGVANPLRDLQHVARYKILAKKVLVFSNANIADQSVGSNTSVVARIQKFTLSWKGDIPVTYEGAAGTIAEVTDNALHVIANATASTAPDIAQLAYNARVRFTG